MKQLSHSFFARPALDVAKALIGTYLVVQTSHGVVRLRITETEAYIGPHDLACHSSKGRTARTEVMYQAPATIYIYLIYGMYYMFNIVTDEKNYPAAVLIRGVEGYDGPGKLTKYLDITKKYNGALLGKKTGIWIEHDPALPSPVITKTPRIGVSYAGPVWSQKKYRFMLRS